MLQITVFILQFSALLDLQLFVGFFAPAFQGADYGSTDHGIWCGLCQSDRVYPFGLFIQLTCEKLLAVYRKTVYSMATQLLALLSNIILDPIMIFGLFGFPRMEVTEQPLPLLPDRLLQHCRWDREYEADKEPIFVKYKISGDVIRSIYSVGFPSIIMASVGSVVMTFGNE